jgi:hypothetical protein
MPTSTPGLVEESVTKYQTENNFRWFRSSRRLPHRFHPRQHHPSRTSDSLSPHQAGSRHNVWLMPSLTAFRFFKRAVCSSIALRRSSILPPVQPSVRMASSSKRATVSRPGMSEWPVTRSNAVRFRRVRINGEHPDLRKWETRVGGESTAA